jgi:DNA replicative helicase MCM subunit Mcm2 (Cdc46/Mcm family)
MLVGDISTAKSKTMRILERISPKADWFTKITEATLEGVSTRGGIEDGIIDKANNGSLLFMDLTEQHISTIREIMDNDRLKIGKGGNEKEIDLDITIQVAENPKSDFFINETLLREQISFTDGLLSRFDVLIPLTTTKEKNEMLLDKINLFGDTENNINLESIAQILKTKAVGMREVKEVVLTNEQKDMIKKIFLKHNIDLKNRPLLVLRDYETLARLVNVVVVSNFFNRKLTEGVIQAEDKDIEKAIMLWETLIDLRKTLFTKDNRITIITIEDKILMEIARYGGKIDCVELEKAVVNNGVCSRATFYRKIERLNGRKININGNKDREVVLI